MSKIENIANLIDSLNSGKLKEYLHQNVELKSSWDSKYGQKISALSNKLANKINFICIGINDEGKLQGYNEEWAKKIEEIISQHLNQFLDPIQACQKIEPVEVNGNWFIVIQAINPGAVVYWGDEAYKATGTTIAEMQPDEIMAMTVKLPGLKDYTAQKWSGAFNSKLVEEFIKILTDGIADDFIKSLKGLSPDEALNRIKLKNVNVSRILFGDFPYRVVYYDDKENPVENKKYNGLFRILTKDFQDGIQRWTKEQISSRDNPYPPRALSEALANCVAHSAYFERHGDIIIELFHDRISISNLCYRESKYFANKWLSRSHNTVNVLLMETLRLSGYVDELGRGKTLIFSESIGNGKKPPIVIIEKSGRLNRWRLYLYGGTKDRILLKLRSRLREHYRDPQKAYIACALVLWRDTPVEIIRQYIDGESYPLFAEVLSDLRGPIFYYKKEDRIILRRWARILIGEGKDSKQFTPAEEEELLDYAYSFSMRFDRGYINPKELRDRADMGNSKSEQTASSLLLQKWHKEGIVKKIKKGHYRFVQKEDWHRQKLATSVEEFLKGISG